MLNDLLFSCNVIVPIFLLIILGYVLTRIKLWDEHFLKIANNLCFKCLLSWGLKWKNAKPKPPMSHPKRKGEKDIYKKENWKLWKKSPRGMLSLRGVMRLYRSMSGVRWESSGMAVFARSRSVYNCG